MADPVVHVADYPEIVGVVRDALDNGFDVRSAREVREMVLRALLVRKGEEINADTAAERAANIANMLVRTVVL